MAKLNYTLRWALPVLLLAAWLQALAITVCPQCAHEQPDNANFCTHCGASLKDGGGARPAPSGGSAPGAALPGNTGLSEGGEAELARAAAAGSATDSKADQIRALVADAVASDVAAAREQIAAGRFEVARAIFANATALAAVSPGAITPEQGAYLTKEIQRCDQLLAQTQVPCPTCKGTGKRSFQMPSISGEDRGIATTAQNCLTCRGSGTVGKMRSAEDLKFVLGQARQQAATALRLRGRLSVGGAWVPEALPPLLDDAAEARLRHAAAAPCPICQGTGRSDCTACANTGFVECRAKGCENGWIIKESLNKLDEKTSLKRREPCPACAGSGRIACATCHGAGATTCKNCNGTGKRALCNSCGGDGTATCRLCRGEGKTRDGRPCPECGGDGISMCPACKGDGYGSR